MKGISIYIIVFFALVCCSIVSSSGLGEINRVNVTMSVYLENNFPKFTAAFKAINPDLWTEITNAPVDLGNTYTVFAVNDTYFNASHVSDATAATFEYHVHGPGPVAVFSSPPALNFTTLDTNYSPPTLDGNKQVLSFSIGNGTKGVLDTFINKNQSAFIVEYNLQATNGMIQSVSEVLHIPSQNVAEVLPASSFSILASLVNVVKFDANPNYLTLLAPVDKAFDTLYSEVPMGPIYKAYFLSNLTSVADSIRAVLTNHVLNRTFYPETLTTGSTTFYTISGSATYVNYENGVVRILESPTGHEVSQVVDPNYIADNGVSHGINQVLIPSGFGLPLSDLLNLLNATDFLSALNRTNLLGDTAARTYFVPTNNVSNIANLNETQVFYYIADTASVSFDNEFAPTLLNLTSLNGGQQHLFLDTVHFNTTNGTDSYTRVNTVKVVSPVPYTTVRGSKVYLIGDAIPVPQLASETLKDNKDTSDFVGLYTERELSGNDLYNIDTNKTTLFVPTNEAFGKVPLGYVGFLRVNSSRSIEVAKQILNNHAAVQQAAYEIPANTVTVYQSANNRNPISVNSTGLSNGTQTIHVNSAAAVQPIPTLTANGVIYYIDGLIVPADVKFTATDVLEGLALENMGGDNKYGDYSTQLEHYEQTGLTNEVLESTAPFTLFAYSNAAWDNSATSFPRGDLNSSADAGKFEELRTLLEFGVVYGENVEELNQSNILIPGNRTNATIEVTKAGPGEKTQVTLRTQDGKSYTATVIAATTTSYNQTIYGLDRVLGAEAREESSGKKLPTWALVLIIVGGIIIGLILLALIVAVVWYLFIRPNREGYRALN